MVKKKTWQEFRKTGLLWFMNTILHAFGWAIVVEVERGEITGAYPERERKYSIIEHIMSYGHQHDLVELAKYDEDQIEKTIGNITAAVAMEYIKGERE